MYTDTLSLNLTWSKNLEDMFLLDVAKMTNKLISTFISDMFLMNKIHLHVTKLSTEEEIGCEFDEIL